MEAARYGAFLNNQQTLSPMTDHIMRNSVSFYLLIPVEINLFPVEQPFFGADAFHPVHGKRPTTPTQSASASKNALCCSMQKASVFTPILQVRSHS